MKQGDIVRVEQLGRGGYTFQDPAYASILRINGPDQQIHLKFLMVNRRDSDRVRKDRDYKSNLGSTDAGWMAPEKHLTLVTKDEEAIVQAAYVLNGRSLVIRSEPVTIG